MAPLWGVNNNRRAPGTQAEATTRAVDCSGASGVGNRTAQAMRQPIATVVPSVQPQHAAPLRPSNSLEVEQLCIEHLRRVCVFPPALHIVVQERAG